MASREIDLRRKDHLVIAAMIAIPLGIAISLLVYFDHKSSRRPPSPSTNIPRIVTATFNLEPSSVPPTRIPIATSTGTFAAFDPTPTAFPGTQGTGLPNGFRVVKWRDDSCDTVPEYPRVMINGVVIVGGTPPYEFTFWQSSSMLAPMVFTAAKVAPAKSVSELVSPTPTPDPDSFLGEIVIFDKPVEVEKAKYVHVTISFNNGRVTWIDDLLYITCSN